MSKERRLLTFHRDHDGQVYVEVPVPSRVEFSRELLESETSGLLTILGHSVVKVHAANAEMTYVGGYRRPNTWEGSLMRFAWVESGLARMLEIAQEHEAEVQRLEVERL